MNNSRNDTVKVMQLLTGSDTKRFIIWTVISALSGLLFTYSIKILHDVIGSEVQLDQILLMIFYFSFSGFLTISSGRRMTLIYEQSISKLRADLSQKVMDAEFEKLENDSHKIIPILMSDMNVLAQFVKSIPETLISLFKLISILIYMFIISYQLAIFIFVVLLLVLLVNSLFLGRLQVLEKRSRTNITYLNQGIFGLVNGIKELILDRKHHRSYIKRNIVHYSDDYASSQSAINYMNIQLTKSSEWIVVMSVLCLVLLSGYSDMVSIDEFIKLFTLILFIIPSIVTLAGFFRKLKRMQASLEKINDLGLTFSKSKKRVIATIESNNPPSIPAFESLELKNLTYHYATGDSKFMVGPIDFKFEKGEIIYITGGNGSGKTSLIKLLTRLYTPSSGEILVNGKAITQEVLRQYQDSFSVAFADSHTFSDLNYLKESFANLDVKKLLVELQLEKKIDIDDFRIDNINLSVGQKGRLNLFRVILEDKPILIFDEWAANQDVYFRDKFYHEIIPELNSKGKTILMISHDEKYYDEGKRIIKMSEGKIVKDLRFQGA